MTFTIDRGPSMNVYRHYVCLPNGVERRKRSSRTVYQYVVAVRDNDHWGIYDWFKSRVTANDARNRAAVMYDEAHVLDVVMEVGRTAAEPAPAKTSTHGEWGTTAPAPSTPHNESRAVEFQIGLGRMDFKAMAKRAAAEEDYAAAWRLEMAAASLAEPRYRDKHLAKAEQYINRTADPSRAKGAISLNSAIKFYNTEGKAK